MRYEVFLGLLSLSSFGYVFTVASAENITYTKPSAGRDLYLTCKGYQVKGASVINVEKPSYLEGTGEQVEFAIISLGDASDGLKVFFDSWGFSSFGLIESHVMHEHWSLFMLGGVFQSRVKRLIIHL